MLRFSRQMRVEGTVVSLSIENQTIRGGLRVRNCLILVKRGESGIVIDHNTILGRPTWRHPIQRFRFWRMWVSS